MSADPRHPCSHATSPSAPAGPGGQASRRSVLAAAAWAAPTITVLSAAPAFAASATGTATVSSARGLKRTAEGAVRLLLTPAPAAALTASALTVSYGTASSTTTTTSFLEVSRTGSGVSSSAVYQLTFTTTAKPVPVRIAVSGSVSGYGTFSASTTFFTGELDATLDTGGTRGVAGSPGSVTALAIQKDGNILIGGTFTSFDGTTINRIARVTPTGALDTTFNPGAGFDVQVTALAIQPDGKILVGVSGAGSFNGTLVYRLVRLTASGSLDTTFNAGSGTRGFDNGVAALVVQPDGKIVVGGSMVTYNGTVSIGRIARLKSDGSLDPDFKTGTGTNPGTDLGFDNTVSGLALQPDGKILVAGAFTRYNASSGTNASRIARLNTDGTLDTTFATGTGFNVGTRALAVQADGKILVGGSFTRFNVPSTDPVNAVRIVRLTSDGTLDPDFNTGSGESSGFAGAVQSAIVDADGRIILSGLFQRFNTPNTSPVNANRIARLNPDGSLDESFDPGTDSSRGFDAAAPCIALDSSGRLVVGGAFTRYNTPSTSPANAKGLARLLT